MILRIVHQAMDENYLWVLITAPLIAKLVKTLRKQYIGFPPACGDISVRYLCMGW